MPSVTQDAQSFMMDGRRIWLVSGLVDYFRIPRAQWRRRIRDAAEAGLNTITVRCPWALHEPRKGDFKFEDDLDIAHFLELIGREGLMCIMRVGPFVGSDLDLGGMPSWLRGVPEMQLRQANAAFLDATSKYFRKLFEILEPYNGSKSGPIVVIQVEHEWYCGNPDAADSYLLEIARFIRERDFDLPMVNTNNLWQHREETIDSWSGYEQMLMHLRQLRTIHRHSPLMVGDFMIGTADAWGRDHAEPIDPVSAMYHLGQVVAAGAQFTLTPFSGGTNFGFTSARAAGTLDEYLTTSADQSAPISEGGERRESYYLMRRLCTFASQFGKVFSSLENEPSAAILAVEPSPTDDAGKGSGRAGPSVVHLRGSQGDIVFIFGDERKAGKEVTVLLPDGTPIPIAFGQQPLAWCLLETHIGGRAVLNWTNLNAFATNNRDLLVLFGAPGQTGLVCINRSELELTVPRGQTPVVEVHEDVTLVVCNTNHVDQTYLRGNTVHIGISGFDEQGNPIPAVDTKRRFEISHTGHLQQYTVDVDKPKKPTIDLEDWKVATIDSYIEGTAPRFAVINGPSTQEQCNAGSGYGFVRISLPKGPGKRMRLLAPGAGDRIHLYLKGQLKQIVGYGPGASDSTFDLHLATGKVDLVALVDNLGRYGGGNDMDEGKGIINHIHEVGTLRTGKPEVVDGRPLRPFELRSFIEGMHANSATSGVDYLWTFMHRKKSPVIMEIRGAETPAIVVVNDQPHAFYSGATGRPSLYLILDDEPFRRGRNEIRISPIGAEAPETAFADCVKFYESKSILDEGAEWAFAKWEQPKAITFKSKSKTDLKSLAGRPAWFRSFFAVTNDPGPHAMWFEPGSMSKGQVYLNGRNLGRYFCATATGKAVGPQKRLYLPPSWIKVGEKMKNELVVFDEHGKSPEKARVVIADSAV